MAGSRKVSYLPFYQPSTGESRLPAILLPPGECATCDRYRESGEDMFPRHAIKDRCNNPVDARYPHCTCDACW
jgi:hypothetical protein